MSAGRPSEYKEEYIGKVDEYLSISVDQETEYHKTRGEKSDGFDRIIKVKLPTVEGFAQFIGVNKTSLYEWEKIHPIFSNALDKIRTEQQKRLIDNGLSGDYNPVIAKLILSANHGMKERSDVTTNDKDIPVPILNALRNNNGDEKSS